MVVLSGIKSGMVDLDTLYPLLCVDTDSYTKLRVVRASRIVAQVQSRFLGSPALCAPFWKDLIYTLTPNKPFVEFDVKPRVRLLETNGRYVNRGGCIFTDFKIMQYPTGARM
jgi:hypothetical protein